MLFIVLFSVVTTFSYFQATFLLKYLEYSRQISPQKYDKTLGTKIRVGLKKFGGDDVVDHVRHF